jgi:hypothetical protein
LIKNFTTLKKKYYFLILLLLFSAITNFFYNIYPLSIRDYDERMVRAYNFCGGISYGYIKKISINYLNNDKRVFIINSENNPSSIGLFPNLKNDDTIKNLILINYLGNKKKLEELKINLNDYNLINKYENCFFYKKK